MLRVGAWSSTGRTGLIIIYYPCASRLNWDVVGLVPSALREWHFRLVRSVWSFWTCWRRSSWPFQRDACVAGGCVGGERRDGSWCGAVGGRVLRSARRGGPVTCRVLAWCAAFVWSRAAEPGGCTRGGEGGWPIGAGWARHVLSRTGRGRAERDGGGGSQAHVFGLLLLVGPVLRNASWRCHVVHQLGPCAFMSAFALARMWWQRADRLASPRASRRQVCSHLLACSVSSPRGAASNHDGAGSPNIFSVLPVSRCAVAESFSP